MSQRLDLPPITAWSLAARLAAAPAMNAWALLAVPRGRVEPGSEDIADELRSLLDAPVERVRVGSPHELIDCAFIAR